MGKKRGQRTARNGQRRTLIVGDRPAEEWVQHHYARRFLEVAKEGVLEGGKVFVANIRHDDWCAIWGGGLCNCDPDIEVVEWKGEGNG